VLDFLAFLIQSPPTFTKLDDMNDADKVIKSTTFLERSGRHSDTYPYPN